MRFLYVCAVMGFAVGAVCARPGVVETVSGIQHAGEIRLASGALVVSSGGREQRVPLEELRRLKFDEAPTARSIPGAACGLLGYYFAQTNVGGKVTVRLDSHVDFDWGNDEPVAGVGYDDFSVIWTGEVEAPETGAYTFWFESDDGGRLFVANTLMGESWKRQDTGEIGGTVTLQKGQRYPLMVFYYNGFGQARARLSWSGPGRSRGLVPSECLHPKSILVEHNAEVGEGKGLLATYYQEPELRGHTFTRVEPGIDWKRGERPTTPGFPTNMGAIRWSGQMRIDNSESYTFHLTSEAAARVWVNGTMLLDKGETDEPDEMERQIPLEGGKVYELRVEAIEPKSGVCLMWSSPSVQKERIPTTHLLPALAPPPKKGAPGKDYVMQPGLQLRNGSFLVHNVKNAGDTAVEISRGWLAGSSISLVKIARVICQPLTEKQVEALPTSRTGVLLASGDFCDGEFRVLKEGRVELNTVLHGIKRFEPEEVAAVVLHDAVAAPGRFDVRLHDESKLTFQELTLAENALQIKDELLGQRKIPGEVVARLECHGTAGQTTAYAGPQSSSIASP